MWATVEDIATHTRWMADAESIEFVTEQRSGVGTEFDCRTRVGPFTTVDRMRVTEWEPGAVMGIEHRGLVTGAGRFTLRPPAPASPSSAGPRTWCSRPRWAAGSVSGRAGPVLERIWRANLRRLRDLAEA